MPNDNPPKKPDLSNLTPEQIQKLRARRAANRQTQQQQRDAQEYTQRSTHARDAAYAVSPNSDEAQQAAAVAAAVAEALDDDHPPRSNLRTVSFTAVLIFLGSMLGTLLGTFTSINDLFDSIERIEDIFNPPTTLCVTGSGTILGEGLGMAATWEAEFEARMEEQGRSVDLIVESTGSIGGVNRAADGGCVHVLAMSEAITPEQVADLGDNGVQMACAVEIGYDVIAFVTDANNSLPALEERFMRQVLQGRVLSWEDVRGDDQPIYIYVRRGSGTTDYVLKEFGWDEGEARLPMTANYLECGSNSECLDKTLGTSGSLYWVSVAWMQTQPPQYLRVLPILRSDERPINPLVDDFRISEYPDKLIRPLYMYVLDSPSLDAQTRQLAEDFLAYVRGVDGQVVLESNNFYNHFERPTRVERIFPEGFDAPEDGLRQICIGGA